MWTLKEFRRSPDIFEVVGDFNAAARTKLGVVRDVVPAFGTFDDCHIGCFIKIQWQIYELNS